MNHSNIYKELKQRRLEKKMTELAPFFLGLVIGASVTLLVLNQIIIKLI